MDRHIIVFVIINVLVFGEKDPSDEVVLAVEWNGQTSCRVKFCA
jgi:hypothetical protein